jgi:hypothetical protein
MLGVSLLASVGSGSTPTSIYVPLNGCAPQKTIPFARPPTKDTDGD